MRNFNAKTAVFKSSSPRLLSLINLDETAPDQWDPEDMAAMVQHQFSAPLHFDLSAAEEGKLAPKTRHQTLTEAAAARIKSFEDLLFHAKPPLQLLRLAKDFFKGRTRTQKKDSTEWQVAYLFYLLTILAARPHDPKISTLTTTELLR